MQNMQLKQWSERPTQLNWERQTSKRWVQLRNSEHFQNMHLSWVGRSDRTLSVKLHLRDGRTDEMSVRPSVHVLDGVETNGRTDGQTRKAITSTAIAAVTPCRRRSLRPVTTVGPSARPSVRFKLHLMRGFHRYVCVPPFPYRRCPLQKYVRITFIRKNSVITPQAYVKNNVLCFRKFAVAFNPFI